MHHITDMHTDAHGVQQFSINLTDDGYYSTTFQHVPGANYIEVFTHPVHAKERLAKADLDRLLTQLAELSRLAARDGKA